MGREGEPLPDVGRGGRGKAGGGEGSEALDIDLRRWDPALLERSMASRGSREERWETRVERLTSTS